MTDGSDGVTDVMIMSGESTLVTSRDEFSEVLRFFERLRGLGESIRLDFSESPEISIKSSSLSASSVVDGSGRGH